MSRGGRRTGAGRKQGAASKKTREIADKAASAGVTPLEFILSIMRGTACPADADTAQQIAFHALRFEAAKAAAPYIHARFAQRDEPVKMEPLTGSLSDQAGRVLNSLVTGTLTPSQASSIMQTIAAQARIVEVDDLERRIKALEEHKNAPARP